MHLLHQRRIARIALLAMVLTLTPPVSMAQVDKDVTITSIDGLQATYAPNDDIAVTVRGITHDGTTALSSDGWHVQYHVVAVSDSTGTFHGAYGNSVASTNSWTVSAKAPGTPGQYMLSVSLYCSAPFGACGTYNKYATSIRELPFSVACPSGLTCEGGSPSALQYVDMSVSSQTVELGKPVTFTLQFHNPLDKPINDVGIFLADQMSWGTSTVASFPPGVDSTVVLKVVAGSPQFVNTNPHVFTLKVNDVVVDTQSINVVPASSRSSSSSSVSLFPTGTRSVSVRKIWSTIDRQSCSLSGKNPCNEFRLWVEVRVDDGRIALPSDSVSVQLATWIPSKQAYSAFSPIGQYRNPDDGKMYFGLGIGFDNSVSHHAESYLIQATYNGQTASQEATILYSNSSSSIPSNGPIIGGIWPTPFFDDCKKYGIEPCQSFRLWADVKTADGRNPTPSDLVSVRIREWDASTQQYSDAVATLNLTKNENGEMFFAYPIRFANDKPDHEKRYLLEAAHNGVVSTQATIITFSSVSVLSSSSSRSSCAGDVMVCPDGRTVHRNPSQHCAFYDCPVPANRSSSPVFCTADAKICPDGSAVSRNPQNNCAFYACPAQSSSSSSFSSSSLSSSNSSTIPVPPAGFEDDVHTDSSNYPNPFSDTDTETTAGQAALSLYRRGVIGGFPDGEFKGQRLVNRAEAAKFLLLSKDASIEDVANNHRFVDVLDDQWYTKYVMTAQNKGIINGYADGTFRPGNSVNTAEFLKMLSLTFDLPQHLPYTFRDVPSDAWYEPYVGIAQAYDLFPEKLSTLEPGRELTRNEVAIAMFQFQFLYRDLSPVSSASSSRSGSSRSSIAATTPAARDDARRHDVSMILDAVLAYMRDFGGTLPAPIAFSTSNICKQRTTCDGLSLDHLLGRYLSEMPVDPSVRSGKTTGYNIWRNHDQTITVSAPLTEVGLIIFDEGK